MPFLYPNTPFNPYGVNPYGGVLPPDNRAVSGQTPLNPAFAQPGWRNNPAWPGINAPGSIWNGSAMSARTSPPATAASWCPMQTGAANGASATGQVDVSTKGGNSDNLKLAGWQMLKIAVAVFTMRAGFHLVPVGISRFLKSSEERLKIETDNRVLKFFVGRIHGVNKFLTDSNRKPHGSRLYKSLMAIVDGLMMLYVGGQVDRYFCKKNDNFKPKEVKDPEKVVDKVLLVLIATERMEAIMHHFFHWLDPKAKSGRQFMYGELAALSAVLMDTTVKIASDRYRIRKNAENSGEKPGAAFPA